MNRVGTRNLHRVLARQTRPTPSISAYSLQQQIGERRKSNNASTSAEGTKPPTQNKGKDKRREVENNEKNDKPLPYQNTPVHWQDSNSLTPYLRKYPALYKGVKFVYDGMGLYAKQGDAVRLAKKIYMDCCDQDIIEEKLLYQNFKLPRTFHTWFQLTNLHVWLLTIRLRALPPPHGRLFIQSFGKRTSERTITSYMKEYKELWNGSQLALDVGLVGGDWELAGAVWRNLWDAKGWDLNGLRGEDGQLLGPTITEAETTLASSRPSSATQAPSTDPSNLNEIPFYIYTLTAYLRRELKRLEAIPDEEILQAGNIGRWGKMGLRGSGDEVADSQITEQELQKWERGG